MSSDAEIKELKLSHGSGKWGFSLPYVSIAQPGMEPQPTSLLSCDLPAWMARTWTVNLNAMRYQSGVLLGTPAQWPHSAASGSGFVGGPDQQTSSLLYLRVDYGVDSAAESILMDYPWSGGTFQICAATIRMYVLPPSAFYNPTRAPYLSGWVAPCDRSATPTLGPTYTVPIGGAQNQTINTDIPRRAIAYRFVPRDANTATTAAMTLQQTDAQTNIVAIDTVQEQWNGTGNGGFGGEREHFFPLDARASSVQMVVGPTGGTVVAALQFLLDPG